MIYCVYELVCKGKHVSFDGKVICICTAPCYDESLIHRQGLHPSLATPLKRWVLSSH